MFFLVQRNVAVNYENEQFFILLLNREMRNGANSRWKKRKLEIFREMIYPDTRLLAGCVPFPW